MLLVQFLVNLIITRESSKQEENPAQVSQRCGAWRAPAPIKASQPL